MTKRFFVSVKLLSGSSRRGAQMGRGNWLPKGVDLKTLAVELTLVRLRWQDGDYDSGGAYWGGGNGDYIYFAQGEYADEPVEVFVRARNRLEAMGKVREVLPAANFIPSPNRYEAGPRKPKKFTPPVLSTPPGPEDWRYLPDLMHSVNGLSAVVGWKSYPPGSHPKSCPIVAELTAVECQLANGDKRWLGVVEAKINSELRMIAHGGCINERNEVTSKYPKCLTS